MNGSSEKLLFIFRKEQGKAGFIFIKSLFHDNFYIILRLD